MARLVVLDRKLNQKHIEITNNIPDTIDIISPQKTNFEIRLNENLNVGDLVFVSNEANNYLGIISEVKNENITTLYTYPIISFTDVPVLLNDINGDVFTWIKNTIESNFVNSRDELFNLPLVIENRANTNATLKYSFDSNNLFDALIAIFKKTGVYIDFELTFTDNGRPESILCKVKNNNDDVIINMREDNPLMITKPIYNFDYSGTNKIIFKPKESGDIYAMYLLKDNTITSDGNADGRITPVVQEIQEYENVADIRQSAEETMLGNVNQFNIQLRLKSNANYPITPFRKFNLITNKSTYETYITKVVNHNDEYYDVVLGVVRNTLTDKLKEVSKSKKTITKTFSGGSSSLGYDDTELRELINNKASLDASNLSSENVESWREKLQVPSSGSGESYDDTELRNLLGILDYNALKKPSTDPSTNQVVTINTNGEQVNLNVGQGLAVDNGSLSNTHHLFMHTLKFGKNNQGYLVTTILETRSLPYTYLGEFAGWLRNNGFTDNGNSVENNNRRYWCSGAGSQHYITQISSSDGSSVRIYYAAYNQSSQVISSTDWFSDTVIQLF